MAESTTPPGSQPPGSDESTGVRPPVRSTQESYQEDSLPNAQSTRTPEANQVSPHQDVPNLTAEEALNLPEEPPSEEVTRAGISSDLQSIINEHLSDDSSQTSSVVDDLSTNQPAASNVVRRLPNLGHSVRIEPLFQSDQKRPNGMPFRSFGQRTPSTETSQTEDEQVTEEPSVEGDKSLMALPGANLDEWERTDIGGGPPNQPPNNDPAQRVEVEPPQKLGWGAWFLSFFKHAAVGLVGSMGVKALFGVTSSTTNLAPIFGAAVLYGGAMGAWEYTNEYKRQRAEYNRQCDECLDSGEPMPTAPIFFFDKEAWETAKAEGGKLRAIFTKANYNGMAWTAAKERGRRAGLGFVGGCLVGAGIQDLWDSSPAANDVVVVGGDTSTASPFGEVITEGILVVPSVGESVDIPSLVPVEDTGPSHPNPKPSELQYDATKLQDVPWTTVEDCNGEEWSSKETRLALLEAAKATGTLDQLQINAIHKVIEADSTALEGWDCESGKPLDFSKGDYYFADVTHPVPPSLPAGEGGVIVDGVRVYKETLEPIGEQLGRIEPPFNDVFDTPDAANNNSLGQGGIPGSISSLDGVNDTPFASDVTPPTGDERVIALMEEKDSLSPEQKALAEKMLDDDITARADLGLSLLETDRALGEQLVNEAVSSDQELWGELPANDFESLPTDEKNIAAVLPTAATAADETTLTETAAKCWLTDLATGDAVTPLSAAADSGTMVHPICSKLPDHVVAEGDTLQLLGAKDKVLSTVVAGDSGAAVKDLLTEARAKAAAELNLAHS